MVVVLMAVHADAEAIPGVALAEGSAQALAAAARPPGKAWGHEPDTCQGPGTEPTRTTTA